MSSTPPHPADDSPEYFLLRPEVERAYGYSHAVRIGRDIKVSGAVSMDNEGNPTAIGDIEQQMKNVYSDLEKVLSHYGCTFDAQYPLRQIAFEDQDGNPLSIGH